MWTTWEPLFLRRVDSRLDEAADWLSDPPSLLAAMPSTGVTLMVVMACGWGWKGGAKVTVGVKGRLALAELGLKPTEMWALLKLGLLKLGLFGIKFGFWKLLGLLGCNGWKG